MLLMGDVDIRAGRPPVMTAFDVAAVLGLSVIVAAGDDDSILRPVGDVDELLVGDFSGVAAAEVGVGAVAVVIVGATGGDGVALVLTIMSVGGFGSSVPAVVVVVIVVIDVTGGTAAVLGRVGGGTLFFRSLVSCSMAVASLIG